MIDTILLCTHAIYCGIIFWMQMGFVMVGETGQNHGILAYHGVLGINVVHELITPI